MPAYEIDLTEDAKIDLSFFKAYERKMILGNARQQLSYEPERETRNRKNLRDNPIGPWELRIGKYRVFYSVDNETGTVSVVSVGWKLHNVLYVRAQEVKL